MTHDDWVKELHAQLDVHPDSELIIGDDEGPLGNYNTPQEYEIVDCQFKSDNTIRLTISKM